MKTGRKSTKEIPKGIRGSRKKSRGFVVRKNVLAGERLWPKVKTATEPIVVDQQYQNRITDHGPTVRTEGWTADRIDHEIQRRLQVYATGRGIDLRDGSPERAWALAIAEVLYEVTKERKA